MDTTTNTRTRKAAIAAIVVAACLPLAGCATSGHSAGTAAIAAVAKAPASDPTPSPTSIGVHSYVALGAFGPWAKRFDTEYGLSPDYRAWNEVAQENCSLQREGHTDAAIGPATMHSLQRAIEPVLARVWAASVLTRCPALLNTPPVTEQPAEKIAALTWVDAKWRSHLAVANDLDLARRAAIHRVAGK